jgi:hypothetical protein
MPNKFARSIPVADYRPQPLLPEGLIPVSRPDGSAEEQLAGAANRLAGTTGAMADDFAKAEGKAAGTIAGNDPHYRPDGSLTIRGQAFNAAATRTYENNLDAQMRSEMQGLFVTNRNNPAALKKAFDDMQARYLAPDGDVFPEIAGEFKAQFARLRLPYENKALGNFEDDQRDQARASLAIAGTAIQTGIAQMAAADPNNPQTAQIVRGEIAHYDQKVDAMVNDPLQPISAETGVKLKTKNRDDALVSAAIAQASALTDPAAIENYRQNAKKKFAAGAFDGLSADGYETLDAELQKLVRAKTTQINQGVTLLGKNLDDYIDRAAGGFNVSTSEWSGLATSPAAQTPKGAALLNAGEAKLKIAGLIGRMSIEDGARMVAAMRAEANKDGASSAGADVVTFAEQLLAKQRTALNTDQLGYAEQRRLVPQVAPLDFQGFATSADPASAAPALAAQVRARTAQAHAIGQSLSRDAVFLRPEEKDRLKDIVAQGGDRAVQLAGAIVKGAGTDAPNVLREISPDAPLLAQAGNIIANGGSLQAARDAFEAAHIKATTGKDLPSAPPTVTARAMRDTIGSAFVLQGEDASRIRATADAITKTRLAAGSIDPKSGDVDAIYRRALQEAAGAQFVGGVQYGGVTDYKPGIWSTYKVPVPSQLRADRFGDVIRAIRDDDLKALPVPPRQADGTPYRARDLAGAIPVAVRGGYRFALGDPASGDPQYIRGANGAPFVLPFTSVLQSFAPRVSGALLGGQ